MIRGRCTGDLGGLDKKRGVNYAPLNFQSLDRSQDERCYFFFFLPRLEPLR